MNRRISLIFAVIGAVLLIGIIGQFLARTFIRRAENGKVVLEAYQDLSDSVVSSYLTRGSFSHTFFTGKMRLFIDNHPCLSALVVYTPSQPEYIYAREPDFLAFNPDDRREWQGAPVFSVNTFFEKVITRPVSIPTKEGVFVSAVFTILSGDTFFAYVRDGLIGLGGLFLLVIIFLAVSSSAKKTDVEEEVRSESFPAVPHEAALQKTRSGVPRDATKSSTETPGSGLFSPHSGLGWEQYLDSRLSFELRRAASFDQDLVLVLFRGSHLKDDIPKYKLIANILLKAFKFQDMLFEYGEDGFAVIVQNTELDSAIPEAEGVLKTVCEDKTTACNLAAGLSSRNGRLITGNRLIAEASRALSKAFSDENKRIVGFRSDPEKYRQYVASQL